MTELGLIGRISFLPFFKAEINCSFNFDTEIRELKRKQAIRLTITLPGKSEPIETLLKPLMRFEINASST